MDELSKPQSAGVPEDDRPGRVLDAVEIKGCDGYGDLHPRLGYPRSANDVPELLDFLRVLKQEGFFRAEDPCVLSMEVLPRPGEDDEIVLANTKRALNRAWAMLED